MPAPRDRSAARRLLLWFAVATVLPTLALVWLGWTLVQQGRGEERTRAAERAAAALERVLVELGDTLGRAATSGSGPPEAVTDAAIIVMNGSGLVARSGIRLPFYPAAPPTPDVDAEFVEASRLELRDGNLPAATVELTALAASPSVHVRAEALLRLARVVARRGEPERALATLEELEKLDAAVAGGVPAGLAARRRRVVLLQDLGRTDEAGREAAGLAVDLASGRWVVTYPQYEATRQFVAEVKGGELSEPDAETSALAEAAGRLGQLSQTGASTRPGEKTTEVVRVGEMSVLVLDDQASERHALIVVGPQSLERLWQAARQDGGAAAFDFALSDVSGRPVLGRVDGSAAAETTLAPRFTDLPWVVHAMDRSGSGLASLSGRSRLMLVGVGIMIVVVLVSGYVLNRSISREIQVARLQSDFVAAVSHEFRTPLTTIRQLSEMLAGARVSSDERRRQFYDTLVAESERLRRMVEALLDFGKMQSGRLRYEFTPVDVPALVSEVAASVEAESPGRRVEFEAAGVVTPARGDREALSRVFRNLIENAVKYSPGEPAVWVEVSNGDGRVRVSVRDRGLGIPLGEQRRIFDTFVRGSAALSAGIKGTGIGLAMAAQIVEAHGGELQVESAPGKGSVFTVVLPAEPGCASEQGRVSHTNGAGRRAPASECVGGSGGAKPPE